MSEPFKSDLERRVEKLEGQSRPEPSRFEMEREQRKEALRQDRLARSALDDRAPQPLSAHRREEMKRTRSELKGHQPAPRPVTQSPIAGTPVEFYCYDQGVLSTLTLLAVSPPSPV